MLVSHVVSRRFLALLRPRQADNASLMLDRWLATTTPALQQHNAEIFDRHDVLNTCTPTHTPTLAAQCPEIPPSGPCSHLATAPRPAAGTQPTAAATHHSTTPSLQEQVTSRLLDRLEDVRRTFPLAVSLGAAGDVVARHVAGGRSGIERMIVVDSSQRMLQRCRDAAHDAANWPQVNVVWFVVVWCDMVCGMVWVAVHALPTTTQPCFPAHMHIHTLTQLEYVHAPVGRLPLEPASVDCTHTCRPRSHVPSQPCSTTQ